MPPLVCGWSPNLHRGVWRWLMSARCDSSDVCVDLRHAFLMEMDIGRAMGYTNQLNEGSLVRSWPTAASAREERPPLPEASVVPEQRNVPPELTRLKGRRSG